MSGWRVPLLTLAEGQRGTAPTHTVEVWHGDLRAFDVAADQPRTLVYSCLAMEASADADVLETAFFAFNVGDDPGMVDEPFPVALEYRDAMRPQQAGFGTRSLSVGDEVRVGGRRYLCMAMGWERVADPAPMFEVVAAVEAVFTEGGAS